VQKPKADHLVDLLDSEPEIGRLKSGHEETLEKRVVIQTLVEVVA
jgi:hypothetical protein